MRVRDRVRQVADALRLRGWTEFDGASCFRIPVSGEEETELRLPLKVSGGYGIPPSFFVCPEEEASRMLGWIVEDLERGARRLCPGNRLGLWCFAMRPVYEEVARFQESHVSFFRFEKEA